MIAIIDYGLGNLRSVKYALDRLDQPCELTTDPDRITEADGVILPGVGAFAHAMAKLRELCLLEPTREAGLFGKPFLGICLGLQLLFTTSEEHGTHEGLNIIPGKVKRFPEDLTVPQMGWNEVQQRGRCPLFEDIQDQSFFYFAHSYYVVPDNSAVTTGNTDYGVRYASMVQKQMVFGTQFHPEKSGKIGLQMLKNFCALCAG